MASFRSTVTTPPGGLWFWEDGEHLVSTPSYQDALDRIRAILSEKGDHRSPVEALAEYMCPRMPRGFCIGSGTSGKATLGRLFENAIPYFAKGLAMANIIQSRLDRCASCPNCRHDVCLTCHDIPKKVYGMFGGRRPSLPADPKSGRCSCAGTFAMVVSSVLYSPDEEVWEGTPSTCWRFT